MRCPVCTDSDLAMTDRQGIEIDYCPKCRGVWLDRGELDKLIERSAAPVEQPAPAAPAPAPGYAREQRHYGHEREQRHYPPGSRDEYYYKRKKKSLLGELFDF